MVRLCNAQALIDRAQLPLVRLCNGEEAGTDWPIALERHNDLADEGKARSATMPIIPARVSAINPQVHTVLVAIVVVRLTCPPEREAHWPLCAHPRPLALGRHVVSARPHIGSAPLRCRV